MDKETLSNYGWIVVLVLAVMLALATPFGSFIAGAIKSTTAGLFSVNQAALGSAGIDVNDMVFENCDHVETEIRNATDTYTGDTCCKACGAVLQAGQTVRAKVPEGGKYTAADGTVYNPGDEMPEVVTTGDTYEYQKYIYKYNQRKNANNGQWETYEPQNGWGVGTVSAGGVKDWGKMLSSINGAPIVSLRRTFGYKTDMIVTPEIPESVTDMYMAFWNCTKITNAPTIPNGIVNLDETFKGCTALTSLPDLSNCTKLTSLKWTFSGCTSITDASDFVIPSGVTNLYDTFQGTGLVNDGMPTIPTTVTTLYETFASCKSLTDLSGFTIPNSVTSLEHTFRFCTSLVKTPTIPNSVTNMSRTFQNCTSLSDNGLPILPNSVTNIHQAFQECAVVDLSDYVIPNKGVCFGTSRLEGLKPCHCPNQKEMRLGGCVRRQESAC